MHLFHPAAILKFVKGKGLACHSDFGSNAKLISGE